MLISNGLTIFCLLFPYREMDYNTTNKEASIPPLCYCSIHTGMSCIPCAYTVCGSWKGTDHEYDYTNHSTYLVYTVLTALHT